VPIESISHVRVAALNGAAEALSVACTNEAGDFDDIRLSILAVAQVAAQDAGTPVRTATVQTFGTLSRLWFSCASDSAVPQREKVLQLVVSLFADSSADVRSAAITTAASLATEAAKPVEHRSDKEGGTGGDSDTKPCASCLLNLHDSPHAWHELLRGAVRLCVDKSDKVRASACRATGHLAQVFDFSKTPFESHTPLSMQDGDSACFPAPPGLETMEIQAPPGLQPMCPAAHESQQKVTNDHMLTQLAETLASAVQAPPAKCQWNACRAVGQMYRNPTIHWETAVAQSLHRVLFNALCHEIASSGNLKVQIQAVQALCQVPDNSSLWGLDTADMAFIALCNAVEGLNRDKAEHGPEDRQRQTYTKSLCEDLRSLGDHWACCSHARLGDFAKQKAKESAGSLRRLVCHSVKKSDVFCGNETGIVCNGGSGDEGGTAIKIEPSSRLLACLAQLDLDEF